MKAKIAVVIMTAIIALMLFSENATYALSTHETIYVTLVVYGDLSMNLEDEWVAENLRKAEVEAFSEAKESGILVDKLSKDNSTVWLFTKTE